jgi:predicted O-methyltransferase YrrM
MVANAITESMLRERWDRVDDYLAEALVPSDPVLEAAIQEGIRAGLPQIQVSPVQARMLHLLTRLIGARRILEIGTLAGYSAIWLARGMAPGGRLITLEANPRHAEVARSNLRRAGLDGTVEVRVGRALESLAVLANEGAGPFDLVFIDADKSNNPEYVSWALRLSHPGSLIIVDNVVRGGALVGESDDPDVRGTRRMFELIAAEPRLVATATQTVGVKGYDGFALLLVTE